MRRASTLLATGLALLALCSPQAPAAVPPKAVLDPTFGGDGLVMLPGEPLGWEAYGQAAPGGDVFVSGGPLLQLLTGSGDPASSFGAVGTFSPPPAEGGEFSLADFTIDSKGRLLVVGTSHFPLAEEDRPRGPNGSPLGIEPSAVRILRFLPDGRLDPTFGQGGVVETDFGLPPPHDGERQPMLPRASVAATGLAVDPQGRIVVTGSADLYLGPACGRGLHEPTVIAGGFVARWTEDGALDPGFSGDGLVGGRKLSETPLRAKVLDEPVPGPHGEVTYRSTNLNACGWGHGRWGMAQLTPEGRTRWRLGRNGALGGYFRAFAAKPDGSVVALARMRWNGREAFRARVVRITPDGTVDRSFGRDGNTVVKLGFHLGNEPDALALDARGRVLLGGTLVTRKGRSTWMVRLSASGRQEMNFGPEGRVVTRLPNLVTFGPSDLFLDPKGRVVTVHRREHRSQTAELSGLVVARYLLPD
ncbi:MAG TPA: hypothetical protein VLI94_11910 [Solirubrobacterales bacterium]|nr:hypothetical protein [Solirubrobacterales bacterium]